MPDSLASLGRLTAGFLLGMACQSVFAPVWAQTDSANAELNQPLPADHESAAIPKVMAELPGKLLIVGGGPMPRYLMERFFKEAGGEHARIVVITTASIYAGMPDYEARLIFFKEQQAAGVSVTYLHTRSRSEALDPNFSQCLEEATGVWFVGGNQNWVTEAYLDSPVEQRLNLVLKRGGIIGGTSAGAAIMSRVMISGGIKEPTLSTGMGFLPGAIVDQHFLKRNRQDRLFAALRMRPGHFGIGVDESTALFVSDRTIEVIGESEVRVCLTSNRSRENLVIPLKSGEKFDPIAFQHAAIMRVKTDDYGQRPGSSPELAEGTLVLAGPGKTPDEAFKQFIAAAGGAEAPLLILSNTESSAELASDQIRQFTDAGARNVKIFRARTRRECNDPKLLALLKSARGVWLDGTAEWKLVDLMIDSHAHELVRQVLKRGGVIGGSSVGAAVQGDVVIADYESDSAAKLPELTEGYERGFGLMAGIAFEPSTKETDSTPEIQGLKSRFPQMVGVEINDDTALIVRGHFAQVVGQNDVRVFDNDRPASANRLEGRILKPGDRYDFKQHLTVSAPVNPTPTPAIEPASVKDAAGGKPDAVVTNSNKVDASK